MCNMKFFIFLFCIAHLLSGISAKIWRTTPMSSVNQKHLNDDEARQVLNFAAMIDFVNNVYNENEDGESLIRRYGTSKRHYSRHFDAPMSALYRSNVKGVSDEDTKAKLDKMPETIRYHVIKNPEVLSDYKNKQKNLRKYLNAVNVFSDIKTFSIAEKKPNDIPSQIEPGTVLHDDAVTTPDPKVMLHNDPAVLLRAHEDDEDQTNDEDAYRPSFPDDDDDKPNTEAVDLKNNKKEIIKTKTDKKDHRIPLDVINTYEFSKKNQNSKTLSKKDKVQIDKNKTVTNFTKTIGPIKNEYSATKQIYSQANKNSVRLKEGVTNENSEKDKMQRSLDKNERYVVKKLISNIDNNLNYDRAEQHSIYAHKEISVSSNKHYNHRKQNKDHYDVKKTDKHQDKREEAHSLWIKVDNENDENLDEKVTKFDENYDKWSKEVKESDKKRSKNDKDKIYNSGNRSKKVKSGDRSNRKNSNKENDWHKNNGRLSKKEKKSELNFDRGSKNDYVKVNNDDSWSKTEKKRDKYVDRLKKDLNKMDKQDDHQDKSIDKMEYEWNKRHQVYDKNTNDDNQNDKDYNLNDNEFKKRDNEWTKRNDERNKKHDRTYVDDKNGPGIRYTDEHIDEYRDLRHGRYKIVDRKSEDSSTDGDSHA